MVSDKESIARLVEICRRKGIRHVVFSPGSRNAPMIISFNENAHFNCLNIPDERSAAFFALGMALELEEPVILCCTSGSAALNYAPALVEAYYQKIPLLVLTADRPVEWIDQGAGQTMRQQNIFANYILGSYQFLQEPKVDDELWYNDRITCEAIDRCMGSPRGPVHINIPFREPLYKYAQEEQVQPAFIRTFHPLYDLDQQDILEIRSRWEEHSRILVICGQMKKYRRLEEQLNRLAAQGRITVLSEATSNIEGDHIISCIDRTIESIDRDDCDGLTPSLLISVGGAVVSKKIRFLLRHMNIVDHWYVHPEEQYIDTYKALTLNIPLDPVRFFEIVEDLDQADAETTSFHDAWYRLSDLGRKVHQKFLSESPWSDLRAMELILKTIPGNSSLHSANSTPVRYLQLFDPRYEINYFSNRGVSGIDGCSSTAAGHAYVSKGAVTLITGDIAFFYDSNALWNHHISPNLKIILINNGGGGIFRFIPGPSGTGQLEEHFEATHQTSAEGLAASFKIPYLRVSSEKELDTALEEMYGDHMRETPCILEVNTPREVNDQVLKEYFQAIKFIQ